MHFTVAVVPWTCRDLNVACELVQEQVHFEIVTAEASCRNVYLNMLNTEIADEHSCNTPIRLSCDNIKLSHESHIEWPTYHRV